ncbi:MAG: pentapeptide repeat-containing protein [Nostoc sp.]
MTDPSLDRKRKKITIAASLKGVEMAEKALIRMGFESKSNFAKSQLLARSTVTKFFRRDPIQLDSFKRICEALELNWKEVVLIPEELEELSTSDRSGSFVSIVVESARRYYTQLTVIDKQTKTVKIEIRLTGHINSVDNLKFLELILQEYSGDTIEITDIKEGSIRLFVEGSPEDIERLVSRIKSGELKTVAGFPVEDVQILSESSDDDESSESDEKWRLVQEIVSQPVKMRQLNGVDLSDADLSGADLSGANLIGADLSGADLRNVDLRYANLSYANLIGADLSDADLSYANLIGADLSDADLRNAIINNVKQVAYSSVKQVAYSSLIRRRKIIITLLTILIIFCIFAIRHYNRFRLYNNHDLVYADLRNADLRNRNLRNADLRNADLRNAKLSGADLRNADLRNAKLSGADLRNAKLSGTDLRNAILNGVNLTSTDLRNAILNGANLTSADLSYAILNGADLSYAILNGADLSYAILNGVDFRKTIFDNTTIISPKWSRVIKIVTEGASGQNLSNVDLSSADLKRTDFRSANLSDANLSDADLRDADLRDADLRDADLRDADLRDADLRDADLTDANVANASFGGNIGLTEDIKRDLERRGAIFGDRPPVLNPK